ncbi:MAG: PfkB family carbohydrate kinase, partial [Pseudomonadota bacterium]
VNLDFVATAPRLPVPGETVTDAVLERFPGGKGANQALAACRLGAAVELVACVGNDAAAAEALALLKACGVELSAVVTTDNAATGIALIAVSADGENQIVVAPGANRLLTFDRVGAITSDALICQLEVPPETLVAVAADFEGHFTLNLAPARDVPDPLTTRADLIVVNETEAEFYGDRIHETDALVAITQGSKRAALYKAGEEIAGMQPHRVDVVDSTAAGDAFAAALTVALVEGRAPEDALEFACAAGSLTATRAGAQPSLPSRAEVEEFLAAEAG